MLSRFFSMHAPMPRAFTGTQYRSAIFYHNQVRQFILMCIARDHSKHLKGGRYVLCTCYSKICECGIQLSFLSDAPRLPVSLGHLLPRPGAPFV
jgi:hypothetical protein